MAKKKIGTAGTSSTVRNVSNSGQMSTSTSSSGTRGESVSNTNVYTSQGAAGAAGQSQVIATPPGVSVGYTAGAWNWMDDAITSAIKNWPKR